MNALIEQLRAKWAMAPTQWVLFGWIMSGLVCITIGFSTAFIPSDSAEIVLIASSFAIGVLIVIWGHHYPESSRKIEALSPVRRAALLLFAPVMFAFMSAGNVYMVLFALHELAAHSAQSTATVSFKGTDLDLPGRCKPHYVRFSDLPRPYITKACVAAETFDSIRPGSKLTVFGSQSPLGFRPETFRLMQANPTAETDARKSGARGSP